MIMSVDLGGSGDLDDFVARRTVLAGLQAELDGLADVGERLVASPSLADATGQNRALGHDPAVLAGTEHDGQCSLAVHGTNGGSASRQAPGTQRGFFFSRNADRPSRPSSDARAA